MITLKQLIETRFQAFLQEESIITGTIPVSVEAVLNRFQSFAPDLPISKSQMGRLLSSQFHKKQFHTKVGSPLIQCYFLNKEV